MKSFNTKIIALSNQKGGVGKTTSAVNIASFLAITETPVLIIDMDPQANASTALGIKQNSTLQSIYEVIINNSYVKYFWAWFLLRKAFPLVMSSISWHGSC